MSQSSNLPAPFASSTRLTRREAVALGLGSAAALALAPAFASASTFDFSFGAAGSDSEVDATDASAVATSDDVTLVYDPSGNPVDLSGCKTLEDLLLLVARSCVTEEVDVRRFDVTVDEYLVLHEKIRLNPWYLHSSGDTYWHHDEDGREVLTKVQLKYRVSGDELANYPANLQAAVANVLAQVDPSASSYEKAAFMHDWLAYHVVYDDEVVDNDISDSLSRTPLGALALGKAVCAGYTSAFQLIMQQLGVPCEYVLSEEMDHAWNEVQIGDDWFYVDATWDDPDAEPYDDQVSRVYFLVGESTLAHDHYGWVAPHEAPTDCYDTGAVHFTTESGSIYDVFAWAYNNGYTGQVDIIGYYLTPDDFSAAAQWYFDTYATSYIAWTWNTNNETSLVRCFTLRYS